MWGWRLSASPSLMHFGDIAVEAIKKGPVHVFDLAQGRGSNSTVGVIKTLNLDRVLNTVTKSFLRIRSQARPERHGIPRIFRDRHRDAKTR